MERDRWLLSLTLSATAASVAGLLVPLYLVRIGGDAVALGVLAAVTSVVAAPGAVLAGRHADRTGNRRRVVVAALATSAVALGVLPLLRSVPAVIAANAVVAFSLAAVSPVVTMLVVADAPAAAWPDRIARLNVFQGYGSTAGLALGAGWTLGVGAVLAAGPTQSSLFALAAAVGVGSAVVAARSLPREASLALGRRRADRVAAVLGATSRNVRDATFAFGTNRVFWALRSLSWRRLRRLRGELPAALWAYFAATVLFFAGFAAFWAPLPLYLTERGYATGAVFALYLVNNVASTLLFEGAGSASGRYDVRLVQGGALGARASAFVGVAVAGTLGVGALAGGVGPVLVVAALLALVGVTWAFIAVAGTAIVSRLAPERARGGVLGLYAALSAVAGSLGGLLGGWTAGRGFDLAFLVAAGLVVAGAVVVLAVRGLSTAGRAGPASVEGGG